MQRGEALVGSRVLVTGAGGFVGRHVVTSLAQAGAYVVALTGEPDCGLPFPVGAGQAAEMDICDANGIRLLANKCEIVVHLAGPPSVARSFENPAAFVRTHVAGTAAVLTAARQLPIRRIVYISSAEVYGRPESDFVNEEHRLQPRSPYAVCKLAAEHLLSVSRTGSEHDTVILRPFSLYGPGAPRVSLISQVVRLALQGKPITLADLRPVRDYCHVRDFARAVVSACMLSPADSSRVINVGTMRGTSVKEVARLTLDALNIELPILTAPRSQHRGMSEIYRLVADNSRAATLLGWSPRVSIEEGLGQLVMSCAKCDIS